MDRAMLITGLSIGAVREHTRLEVVFDRLEAIIEDKLEDETDIGSCDGTILCSRIKYRHKSGCYGKPMGLQW